MKRRIKVAVGPGVFASERSASFEVNGTQYTLIVEADSLKGDALAVRVVAEGDHEAIIDLPRDTILSGNRIRVPKERQLPT
jgi:hypothetical protein